MGAKTKIEWADSTFNLEMGCDGCELWPGDDAPKEKRRCYAGNLTAMYGGPDKKGWPEAFSKPRIFPERLQEVLRWSDLTGKDRPDKPWLNGLPRVIFLNDMGETFTESLPVDWFVPYITPLHGSRHIIIILTKRPTRMLQCFQAWGEMKRCHGEPLVPIPPNFWLLTSVSGPENVGRIRELLKLRELGARVLGVSYEPALGPVDFAPFVCHPDDDGSDEEILRSGYLDWIIAGGESGPGARPAHPRWFRDVRDECQAAAIPYFFKQWGAWAWLGLNESQRGQGASVPSGIDRVPNAAMHRVGKHAAGRLLDGREWDEMPLGMQGGA